MALTALLTMLIWASVTILLSLIIFAFQSVDKSGDRESFGMCVFASLFIQVMIIGALVAILVVYGLFYIIVLIFSVLT